MFLHADNHFFHNRSASLKKKKLYEVHKIWDSFSCMDNEGSVSKRPAKLLQNRSIASSYSMKTHTHPKKYLITRDSEEQLSHKP